MMTDEVTKQEPVWDEADMPCAAELCKVKLEVEDEPIEEFGEANEKDLPDLEPDRGTDERTQKCVVGARQHRVAVKVKKDNFDSCEESRKTWNLACVGSGVDTALQQHARVEEEEEEEEEVNCEKCGTFVPCGNVGVHRLCLSCNGDDDDNNDGEESGPLQCLKCGLSTFDSKYALAQHVLLQHEHLEASLQCPTCCKKFSQRFHLECHMRAHLNANQSNGVTGAFSCSVCGKTCSTHHNLVRHSRIHSEDNPFVCPTCHKAFSDASNLLQHVRSHIGDKPFHCLQCGMCFTTKSHLVRHTRIHLGQKPFECVCCGKAFRDRGNLAQHMRTHTGEKPFECTFCEKCFATREPLVRHMRIHTGEKPFECPTCKKTFRNRGNLVQHIRTHTGEKPFECSFCNKCFAQMSTLSRHICKIHEAPSEPVAATASS